MWLMYGNEFCVVCIVSLQAFSLIWFHIVKTFLDSSRPFLLLVKFSFQYDCRQGVHWGPWKQWWGFRPYFVVDKYASRLLWHLGACRLLFEFRLEYEHEILGCLLKAKLFKNYWMSIIKELIPPRRLRCEISIFLDIPLRCHAFFAFSSNGNIDFNYCINGCQQQGWCDSPGTVDEVKAKLQMKQEGAIKRERAMAYSLSQQVIKLGKRDDGFVFFLHFFPCLIN